MTRTWPAVGMILTATFFWSLMAPISKSLFAAGVDPLTAVLARALVGGILLAAAMRVVRGHWRLVSRTDAVLVLLYGVCMAGNYLTYFKAFEAGTVTVAAIALHTYPVFVATGARVLYGELFTVRRTAAMVLAAVGIVLLTGVGNPMLFLDHAAGAGWAVISAVFLSGHILLAKRLVQTYDPFTVVYSGLLVAGVLLLGARVLTGPIPAMSAGSLGLLAILIVCSTVGAYCLFTNSIRYVPVGWAGIVTLSEPVWVMGWGRFLLGERVSGVQSVGVVLIVLGVLLVIGERAQIRIGRWTAVSEGGGTGVTHGEVGGGDGDLLPVLADGSTIENVDEQP